MRYEQVVTLSSTVTTNAEDKEQAAEQIHRMLDNLCIYAATPQWEDCDGELYIGEYEREDEPTLMEEK